MGYQRSLDEEPTRISAISCINDGNYMPSYALSLTTTDLTVEGVAPNIYRAFLEGMDAGSTVAFITSRIAGDPVELPTPNTWTPSEEPPVPADVTLFPGNMMVRIRIMPGKQVLVIRMLTGSGMLYLVPTYLNESGEEQ